MASVNKVIILGRLGADPKFQQTNSGKAICRMRVATSRRYKDRDGNRQEETEWHSISVFDRQAEIANQYLQKGSEVYIEGRLRTRSDEKDGVKRYFTDIVCESLQLGARATAGDGQTAPAARPSSAQAPNRPGSDSIGDGTEDIPF